MAPLRRSLAALVTVMALGLPVAAAPAAAQGCADPFTPAFRDSVAASFPGQRVTASVHDTRTGCWYDLAPGMPMQTASVIKSQFLAGVLLRAHDEGRGLTAWERDRIGPMMWYSHNPPASDLFVSLGGVGGQERLDQRFGLTATTSTTRWGATTSTARDRTLLALQLLHAGGPLPPHWRAEAWRTMAAVHPTQTWGITAGVPAGWSVALKNGFYPTSGAPRWRIGSSGFVRHDATGQGYAITVMSDQNADHGSGQRLVEVVARRVAEVLTDGTPAPRAVDRSRCTATRAGQTWADVARTLGTTDVAGVRIVSGGPTSPLAGMRACRPDLLPAYDPQGASARYVRALFETFLGRPATAHDAEHHATLLDTGALDPLALATALARSDEHLGRAIDELYRAALDRTADPAGLATWRAAIRSGTSLAEVAVHVYGSAELRQRAGGTDAAFVEALYRRLLGREADAGGRAHWVGALAAGASDTDVARSLHGALESRRSRVARVYEHVLGRAPDPGGLAHWAARLASVDDVVLAATLATSAEYVAAATR